MPLKIDLSELNALAKELQTLMRDDVPAILKSVVDLGAAYARSNHEYVNRTGNLTKSTVGAWVSQRRDEQTRNLEADMPYASYVRARGLMGIDYAAGQVEAELNELFAAIKVS